MKKYSDLFLNNIDILSKSTIGFEFEFYINDLSFHKTLEILNSHLKPVVVVGFRQYHSDFIPTSKTFKIEPDLSGGSNMVELITGPLPYYEARIYLNKILLFINEYGYTNEKCSIHFNISYKDENINLNHLNKLKLILNLNEDEIYRYYPSRKGNIYAKSIKSIIPYKDFDFNNIDIKTVKNMLKLPNDKYYGVNFLNMNNDNESQRLEFRYIGGANYEKNYNSLLYFMNKFIMNVYTAIVDDFNNVDIEMLNKHLYDNIKNYKKVNTYDLFLIEYPSISLQINQEYNYDVVSMYYPSIFNRLYDLINSFESFENFILNYNSGSCKFEIVDGTLNSTSMVKNVDIINCNIKGGLFEDVEFLTCNITDTNIMKSKFYNSVVNKCKLQNIYTDDNTEIKDSYIMGGYINCEIMGGVLRSGKIGPNAVISKETKIVTENGNFFSSDFKDADDNKMLSNNLIMFKDGKK